MRLLFCSPADSKVLCGFIVSFLAPTVADRQRALCYTSWPPLLSCKCFIISVFPTLDFNWLCDSLLVLLRLYHSYRIIALGLHTSFNASCLSAWISLFFDIDLLTLDCSFSDLPIHLFSFFSFLHLNHSIRPAARSMIWFTKSAFVFFPFSVLFLCSVLCRVLLGFVSLLLAFGIDGMDFFLMGYMGWYQIRLDSSASRSNHLLLLRFFKITFVMALSAFFASIIIEHPRITTNACRCAQICSTHDQLSTLRLSPLVWQLAGLQCTWHYLGGSWSNIWNFSYVRTEYMYVCLCMYACSRCSTMIPSCRRFSFWAATGFLHKSCCATSTA